MRRLAKWLIVLGWLGFMMALSRQAGEDSLRLSAFISRTFVKLLSRFGVSVATAELDPLLRKAAHFILYLVAAVLLYGALAEDNSLAAWRGILLTVLICGAVAILDEYQKAYIPGRHCAWSEAALNCAGALAGATLRRLLSARKAANADRRR